MSIHKTFSPDIRQLQVDFQREFLLQKDVMECSEPDIVVGVDIPFRQPEKNHQLHIRAATSEVTLRNHHTVMIVTEAPELAKQIRERHKQIKSHFRDIKLFVNQP